MEVKMRRFLLLAVLAVSLLPIGRHAAAVSQYGYYVIFYDNTCGSGPYLYRSSPGNYLGSDYYDCAEHNIDGVLERDLIVNDNNWKQEWVFDCQTGATISHTLYIGGHGSWHPATPGECVWGG